jgi:membrane-associated protease RseP (regulator of RpoE activity)
VVLRPPDEGDRPWSPSEKALGGGFCVLFFGLLAAELVGEWTPGRLAVPVFVISWAVLTVIHEIGHAFVARAVGWRVDSLRVGFGPPVKSFVWGGVAVELRAFPIVGLVRITPGSLDRARSKNAAIFAAGPGVELLMAVLAGLAIGFDTLLAPSESLGIVAVQAFALAAVVGAAVNLIPFSPQPGVVTDGMGIILSAFMNRGNFESQVVRPELGEGAALLAQGKPADALAVFEEAATRYPDVLLLQTAIAHALVDLGRSEEALLHLRAFAVKATDRAEADKALAEVRAYIKSRSGTGA